MHTGHIADYPMWMGGTLFSESVDSRGNNRLPYHISTLFEGKIHPTISVQICMYEEALLSVMKE